VVSDRDKMITTTSGRRGKGRGQALLEKLNISCEDAEIPLQFKARSTRAEDTLEVNVKRYVCNMATDLVDQMTQYPSIGICTGTYYEYSYMVHTYHPW
jgi:hypothetical protein